MSKSRFKKMSFDELDKEIDSLPYNWMKAIMLTSIQKVRKDYKYKERRNEYDRKSKSISSRQISR